jgi:uncharacterized membrane protein
VVSSHREEDRIEIILRPNRSADWRTNRLLLLSLAAVSLVIGGGFAAAGAWMILPFAGLEVMAVGGALYWVSWKLSYQQVITVAGASLSIDKGVYRPRRSWRFARAETSVAVHRAPFPHEPPRISLCNREHHVRVGEFLSLEEGQHLLRALRESGLRVRDHGHVVRRRF